MKRVSLAMFALCSALLGTRDLSATTCSTPLMVVIPGTRAPSPLNTHVWVYAYDDAQDPLRFELRSAPGGKSAGATIPTSLHRMPTGNGTFTVELVPEHDLSPKTRFEVWAVGKSERMVGTFKTGTEKDTHAPSWSGADKVAALLVRAPKSKAGARRVIVLSDQSGLRVSGSRASDAEGRVLYAAWKGEAGKPIDFSRPPDGYTYDTDANTNALDLVLGSPGTCFPTTFAVPDDKSEIQIGLAAVDLAGNRGATSEHRVKL